MNNKIHTVQDARKLSRYTRRFAFTVGMGVSMNLTSISGNLSHSLVYYARINYLPGECALLAGMALLLAMCVGLTLVAVGSRSGPPVLISVAALNALFSAGYLANNPVTLFALFPLFQSLFCLMILNTRNHRRFISMLRVNRRRKIRTDAQT